MPGVSTPRHDVYLRQVAAADERQRLLGGLVDVPLVYRGPDRHDLYPERVGCACRVVLVSESDHICPLILEFRDGFRAIAEPEWLAEPC